MIRTKKRRRIRHNPTRPARNVAELAGILGLSGKVESALTAAEKAGASFEVDTGPSWYVVVTGPNRRPLPVRVVSLLHDAGAHDGTSGYGSREYVLDRDADHYYGNDRRAQELLALDAWSEADEAARYPDGTDLKPNYSRAWRELNAQARAVKDAGITRESFNRDPNRALQKFSEHIERASRAQLRGYVHDRARYVTR